LGDEVRITVIAAGFDGGEPKHRKFEASIAASAALASAEATALDAQAADAAEESASESEVSPEALDAPAFEFAQSKPKAADHAPGSFGDDLDLPEFFR
jgi:cell division protein FtsZ